MTPPFIVLAMPLYGYIDAKSYRDGMMFLSHNLQRGILQGMFFRTNVYIDEAYNSLVARVLDEAPQATHIAWMEQDMTLPLDCFKQLWEDDKDVVSAVYFDAEAVPVGWESLDPEPKRLATFDPTGLQQVAGFGTGAALVRTDLYRRMARHFGDAEWYRSTRRGQDHHFCLRCREMGVPIWLDGRVQCGHNKIDTITIRHYEEKQKRERQRSQLGSAAG